MDPQNSDVTQSNFEELYSFISPSLLADIIKREHADCDTLIVEDFKIRSAVPEGENFCSQMLRTYVQYKVNGVSESTQMVFKVLFTKESLNARIDEINAFGKEIILFTKILPQVENLLSGIGDDVKLAAKCYSTGDNPQYLCFEDLRLKGYVNLDKSSGLSLYHLKSLFTKLAKYHAGTAKLLLDNQIDTAPFEKHAFQQMTGGLEYMQSTLQIAANAVSKWEGYEEIALKLRRLSENHIANLERNIKRDLNGFLVVLHGDLWTNNVMFKMAENGEIDDVLMVDFQIGYWGSPTQDLTYCIFSSGFVAITEEEMDLAIQNYYQVLVETLKSLNYPMGKVPSLRHLRADMFQRFFLETVQLLQISSFLGKKLTFDMDSIFEESDEATKKQQARFDRPEFRKLSEPWLKYMDRKGLLD